MPYGLAVFSYADHGIYKGAFQTSKRTLENVYRQLKGKYAIRVAECGGRVGLAKVLLKMNKRYGDAHKIAFGILAAHGEADSIDLGGEDARSLRISDLTGEGSKRVGNFFEKGADLILMSCSTGAQDGIGQQRSEVTGLRVLAPNAPTETPEMNVRFEDGRPRFEVKYNRGAVSEVYSKGKREHG